MTITHRADASALLDNRGYAGPLVRGQNPATLIETGLRDRITESLYWKEQCFALNEASLCDRAAELSYFGGTYGDVGKPTPFLCLLFKLLQLQPSREVVLEYLNFVDPATTDKAKQKDGRDGDGQPTESADDSDTPDAGLKSMLASRKGEFKYLRALAAFYIRLAWEPVDIYNTLEPLLLDYRRLRRRTRTGFVLSHIDSFIDDLLTKDRLCGTAMWKLPSRLMLEELDKLDRRISPIEDELDSDSEMSDRPDSPVRQPERESQPKKRSPIPTPASAVISRDPPAPATNKPDQIANEEATKQARSYGPEKASSNVRYTHYTDFAPDICKDYRQTGFCGFGDSCKFLHIREDYKQGWALDRDWEVNQKKAGAPVEADDKTKKVADDGTPIIDGVRTKCFLCKNDYIDPVVTRCSHYFCERCALARKSTKCAVCKAETGGMFTSVSKQGRRKMAGAGGRSR